MEEISIAINVRQELNKRIIHEGIARIKKCLSQLDQKQIWHKHNDQSNSTGHLILHLNGNVRQWLLSAIGGEEDKRDRDSEFLTDHQLSVPELNSFLDLLAKDVQNFSDSMVFNQLTSIYSVQGYSETGLSIIIHVIEHFSYHVGQITYYTKFINNIDVGYYDNRNLNELNW